MTNVVVALDDSLKKMLDEVCERSGRSENEVISDALKRQLSLARFEELRRATLPFAEARGYLTDEDVFRDVS